MLDDPDTENQKQFADDITKSGTIFQSFWIRHNSILACMQDRKFVACESRVVCYSGIFLWAIYLLSQAL